MPSKKHAEIPSLSPLARENELLRKLVLSANSEVLDLKSKIGRRDRKIERLEALEFASGEIRKLHRTQMEAKISNPVAGSSDLTDTKFLQLQLMLPDIIRGWQADKRLSQSVGTQTKIHTTTVSTCTAEDQKGVVTPQIEVDDEGKIPAATWKQLSKNQRRRVLRKITSEDEYDPANPFFSPTMNGPTSIKKRPRIIRIDLTIPPKRAKMIVEEGSSGYTTPTDRDSISARLVRLLAVDIDRTPRNE